jgi:glycosyltransferase involved in cell wall biosynthesis
MLLSTIRDCKIAFIGPLPPPLHGMAYINGQVVARLTGGGVHCFVLNTAAVSIYGTVYGRLRRVLSVVRAAICLAIACSTWRRGGAVYMSLSGGLGQVYEIVFLWIARICGARVFVHHHSYSYIDKWKFLTSIFMRSGGGRTQHIVLSRSMRLGLLGRYGDRLSLTAVSNAAFMSSAANSERPRRELHTLGFLGNIIPEKGVYEFLALSRRLKNSGVRCIIAGPIRDNEVAEAVAAAAVEGCVEYVGAVYGAQKAAFLESIDLLIFPTRYVNEAEPVTVLEAFQNAIPVIAFERGSISELLEEGGGVSLAQDADFVSVASDKILAWRSNAAEFAIQSRLAVERFERLSMTGVQWRSTVLGALAPEAAA